MSRDYLDRYYTPEFPTIDLINNHLNNAPKLAVLDPCCGDGLMSRILMREGVALATTLGDIAPHPSCKEAMQWDFLKQDTIRDFSHGRIVTNPPYLTVNPITGKKQFKLSDFAKACLRLTPRVALLTRLPWLEMCKDRSQLFSENPPSKVLLLPRIEFSDHNGKSSGPGTSMPSIWVIWEDGAPKGTEFVFVNSSKGN